MTRHRVGLKRSFYTALGITAGAAASLYAQRQLSLPPDEERAGPPPAVLRAKVAPGTPCGTILVCAAGRCAHLQIRRNGAAQTGYAVVKAFRQACTRAQQPVTHQ